MVDQSSSKVFTDHYNAAQLHENQNGPEANDSSPHHNRRLKRDNSRVSAAPRREPTRFMQNSLRQFSPEELDAEVDMFVGRNSELKDLLELLRQGAQIARDPFAPQSAKGLLPEDQKALRDENEHPFRYPLKYWFTIGVCCFSGALQGWNQVGIVPANDAWLRVFGVDNKSEKGKCDIKSEKQVC